MIKIKWLKKNFKRTIIKGNKIDNNKAIMSDNDQEQKSVRNKFNLLLKLITKEQFTGQLTTFKSQSRNIWL